MSKSRNDAATFQKSWNTECSIETRCDKPYQTLVAMCFCCLQRDISACWENEKVPLFSFPCPQDCGRNPASVRAFDVVCRGKKSSVSTMWPRARRLLCVTVSHAVHRSFFLIDGRTHRGTSRARKRVTLRSGLPLSSPAVWGAAPRMRGVATGHKLTAVWRTEGALKQGAASLSVPGLR